MSHGEQQNRGGLIPIGKVAVRLPSIEGRGRAMSARARNHFTRLRQVNQLIEAGEAEPDLGFMARLLALCSLPRTNPGDRLQYKRVNGPYKLIMIAGGDNKLPYGNLPRLLLAWVCTEAVRTQRRELVLGRSLYEFMHKLGMKNQSGGERGDRTRLKNQMRRLFTCSVQLVQRDGDHAVRGEQRRGPLVAAHDQLEQVFGGGVRQLSHAEVVDDEQGHAGQLGQVGLAGVGEGGLGELLEEGVGLAIDDAVALLDGGASDGLGKVAMRCQPRGARRCSPRSWPVRGSSRRTCTASHCTSTRRPIQPGGAE